MIDYLTDVGRFIIFYNVLPLAMISVMFFGGFILGLEMLVSYPEALSNYFVTGSLLGIDAWRIHILFICGCFAAPKLLS